MKDQNCKSLVGYAKCGEAALPPIVDHHLDSSAVTFDVRPLRDLSDAEFADFVIGKSGGAQ